MIFSLLPCSASTSKSACHDSVKSLSSIVLYSYFMYTLSLSVLIIKRIVSAEIYNYEILRYQPVESVMLKALTGYKKIVLITYLVFKILFDLWRLEIMFFLN